MTTTPQAALLTDDEVAQCINLARTNLFDRAGTTSFRIARSIEQAILAKLQATQEPLQAIPEAMKVVTEALRSDPDYAWSWHCNVAMASVDEGMGHYEANKAAARFMRLLAGVDTTKHQGFPEAPKKEPVHAGELPAFEQWWRQRQLLTFPKDYDQSRLADWGAAYKPAAKDAWQARAALSARKPLVHGDLNPDRIFGLADVHAEESQEDGRRIFDRDGLVGFAMDAARIGSYQAMDPLTKEQIKDLAQDEELLLICDGFDSLEDIVSVIERAHGIGLEVKP